MNAHVPFDRTHAHASRAVTVNSTDASNSAQTAAHNRSPLPNELTQQAQQILQLWKLMDFTTVESLPTKSGLQTFERKLNDFQGFDVRRYSAEHVTEAQSANNGTLQAAGDSQTPFQIPRKAKRSRVDYSFRIPLFGADYAPRDSLSQLILTRTALDETEVLTTCHVLLGSVAREACIRAFSLACCGSMAPLNDERRPEPDTTTLVPLLEFDIDREGKRVPETTKLSPLIALLDRLVHSGEDAGSQKLLDDLLESLSKRIEDYAIDDQRISADSLTTSDLVQNLRRVLAFDGLSRTFDLLREAAATMSRGDTKPSHQYSAQEVDLPAKDATNPKVPVNFEAYVSLTIFKDEETAKLAQEEPAGLMGPFYNADLEMVEDALSDASADRESANRLANITRCIRSATLEPPASRLDVLTGNSDALERFYADALGPKSIPLGRWPSRFDPALMQQVAINLTLRNVASKKVSLPDGIDIPNYFSVNGPPGTGKTTMLKDVIAGCVVEKARVLASYTNPDEAFKQVHLRKLKGTGLDPSWTFVNSFWRLRDEAAEASNYSILVASSNNAAVENISKELPELDGLLGGLDDEDEAMCEVRDLFVAGAKDPTAFFSGWAQKLHDKQQDDGRIATTSKKNDGAPTTSSAPKVRKRWGTSAMSRDKNDDHKPPTPSDVWGLVSVPLGKMANIRSFVHAALMDMGWNHGIAQEQASRNYEVARHKFLSQYDHVSNLLKELERVAEADSGANLARAWEQLDVKVGEPCRAINGTHELVELLAQGFGFGKACEDDAAEEAKKREQLAVMWTYRTLNRERERLFAYAMNLTCRFVQASKHAQHNLRLLGAMWGASLKRSRDDDQPVRISFSDIDRDVAMPSLLQTLSLAVPVVSTTFASAGRMLAHVHVPETYGLLIIDEAGQAVPSQAVGSLFRARRALVVGDPKQIEPVVTEESKLISQVFPSALRRSARDTDSVQSYVDTLNPIGSTLGALPSEEFGDPLWMGSPLLVHRRCISPMFDISNCISYEGAMLMQTLAPKPSTTRSFCLPTSFWLEVEGHERGNKDHYVNAQAQAIIPFVAEAFQRTASTASTETTAPNAAPTKPSLFLISPFTSVVHGLKHDLALQLKKRLTDNEVAHMDIDDWCRTCIGTVHTFQGKEANEVFLVLGCDDKAKGAVRWVKPNIVNVAATRAKYRFCTVGSIDVWQPNKSVKTLMELLGSWLATQAALHEGELAALDGSELKQMGYPPREDLPRDMFERPSFTDDETWYFVKPPSASKQATSCHVVGETTNEVTRKTRKSSEKAPEARHAPAPSTESSYYIDVPEKGSLDDEWLSATLTIKYFREREGVNPGAISTARALNQHLRETGMLDSDGNPTPSGLAAGIRIGRRSKSLKFLVYGTQARAWIKELLVG